MIKIVFARLDSGFDQVRIEFAANRHRLKTASTVHCSAPVRMSDLSARSPSKSCSAPMMIDLPAPVSPVTAVKPGAHLPLEFLHQREVLDSQQE